MCSDRHIDFSWNSWIYLLQTKKVNMHAIAELKIIYKISFVLRLLWLFSYRVSTMQVMQTWATILYFWNSPFVIFIYSFVIILLNAIVFHLFFRRLGKATFNTVTGWIIRKFSLSELYFSSPFSSLSSSSFLFLFFPSAFVCLFWAYFYFTNLLLLFHLLY